MKKFIIKITYFIIPIVLIFFCIEYELGKIENSYTFKKKNFEKRIEEIEEINLGSSHANCGFDPDFYV